MNIQEAKQIRIADYLQSLGYTPVKQQGNSLWYKSPLREETDASFKVNTEINGLYYRKLLFFSYFDHGFSLILSMPDILPG